MTPEQHITIGLLACAQFNLTPKKLESLELRLISRDDFRYDFGDKVFFYLTKGKETYTSIQDRADAVRTSSIEDNIKLTRWIIKGDECLFGYGENNNVLVYYVKEML